MITVLRLECPCTQVCQGSCYNPKSPHEKDQEACSQFLGRADTSPTSWMERKPINSHWLKHANLMPVLNYLAAKAEGLWCDAKTRHLYFPCLMCWTRKFKMWGYPHLKCFCKNRTDMTKTWGKERPMWVKGHPAIQSLRRAVCESTSPHWNFGLSLQPLSSTPLQP